MTTENDPGSEEPQTTPAQELEALQASIKGMDGKALEAEYTTRRTEYDYLANKAQTVETRERMLVLRDQMELVTKAHASVIQPVEPPSLTDPEAQQAPKTPEGSNGEGEGGETPPAEGAPAGGTPPAEGGTENPPAEGAPADGGETPPANSETPPADGGETPPADGGGTTPPADPPSGDVGGPISSGNAAPVIVEPFKMEGGDTGKVTSIEELGLAMASAGAHNGYQSIGKLHPYGSFDESQKLGLNPIENYRLMYGDDTSLRTAAFSSAQGSKPADKRSSFTAALNCKGPAQPVMDIPFCYTAGRPLFDSGLVSAFPSVHGQIQIYDVRRLPERPEGILEDAADCEDCGTCPDVVCARHECIQPLPPIEPSRYMTCMCVPESLQFSNPIVLERALEEFAIWNDIAYELDWLKQIRDLSVVRTIDGSVGPHGANSVVGRSMYQLKSRMAIDVRRNCGGLNNYDVFIPGGEALFCSTMMDRMSRVLGCACPGEDILALIEEMTSGRVIFGLDQDPDGPQIAEGYTTTWFDGPEPALGKPAPLEPAVDAGEMLLIPRDSLATASPMSSEIGMGERDRCTHAGGCMKMQRAEWWFPIFKVGSRHPVLLEFTNLDNGGSGPDLKPAV